MVIAQVKRAVVAFSICPPITWKPLLRRSTLTRPKSSLVQGDPKVFGLWTMLKHGEKLHIENRLEELFPDATSHRNLSLIHKILALTNAGMLRTLHRSVIASQSHRDSL